MSRKLDAAIAEGLGKKVEWKMSNYEWSGGYYMKEISVPHYYDPNRLGTWRPVPNYSSDGNAMLELIGEMKERGYSITITCHQEEYYAQVYQQTHAELWTLLDINTQAPSLPLAVALAAHKALTGKEWSE